MARTLNERLDAALQKVKRPGTFCVTGSDRAANPGLEVAGLGPIGLPLSGHQAAELKARCGQAPFGDGAITRVDTQVRRVWKLRRDDFLLTNPDWDEFLRGAVVTVQLELGLEDQKLYAHLYDLLLYEPGSFFLPHRDGERLDRMVATLVVVLPSAHAGGELVVRHEGQERVIDFGGPDFNPFHMHFAAFYADCEHEVRPLKSGYRLCLIYNLTLAKSKKAVTAPKVAPHVEEVARILKGWTEDDEPTKLVVPLGHQYTPDGIAWDTLKGVDRVKATVLNDAAKLAGCQAHLALLTFWESGSAEEVYDPKRRRQRYHDGYEEEGGQYKMDEVIDSSLTAEKWSDADGSHPEFGSITVDEEEEVVPPDALTRGTPEEEYEGFTGNEGMTLARWYRHAAIVVWPDDRHFDVLCDGALPDVIASLRQAVEASRKNPTDDAARERCVDFAWKVTSRCNGDHCADAEANALFDALFALDDPKLLREFFRGVVRDNPRVYVERMALAFCEKQGWAAAEEDVTALFTATNIERVTQVAGPAPELLPRNLRLLEALALAKSRRKKDEAERVALCGRLGEVFVANLEALDTVAAACQDWRVQRIDRVKLLTQLPRALLATGHVALLTTFIERVLATPKLYPLPDQINAATELAPWFKANLTEPCEPVSRWLAALQSQVEALTAIMPTPPTDFRRDADLTCKCADCAELRAYLENPTEHEHRFRAVQSRRSHLEHEISRRKCDLDCTTSRVGSPHTLVCTKNQASYLVRLEKYHDDCRHLDTIRGIEKALPA